MTQATSNNEETCQERWARERKALQDFYQSLYDGVASHLDGWKVVDPRPEDGEQYRHERLRLVHQPFMIDLKPDVRDLTRGKVTVSGYWPQRTNHGPYSSPSDVGEQSPSIGVSFSRGYEAIAKEIKKRFLPEYFRIHAKIQERLDREQAYNNRKMANWQRLVDSGLVYRPKSGDENRDPTGDVRIGKTNEMYNFDKGYGDIRMTGEDSVEIKLRSLPVNAAIRVLRALNSEDEN